MGNQNKLEWYMVVGIRHKALVRAVSDKRAIEMALEKKIVGDWETPIATAIGSELPDVLEV